MKLFFSCDSSEDNHRKNDNENMYLVTHSGGKSWKEFRDLLWI